MFIAQGSFVFLCSFHHSFNTHIHRIKRHAARTSPEFGAFCGRATCRQGPLVQISHGGKLMQQSRYESSTRRGGTGKKKRGRVGENRELVLHP